MSSRCVCRAPTKIRATRASYIGRSARRSYGESLEAISGDREAFGVGPGVLNGLTVAGRVVARGVVPGPSKAPAGVHGSERVEAPVVFARPGWVRVANPS
jgi:hypothetical protein